MSNISNDTIQSLLALKRRSVELLLSEQRPSGAFVASPNFDVYQYSWFRDGAFIADALSAVEEYEAAAKFHTWAAEVVLARATRIQLLVERAVSGQKVSPEDHLPCRYTVDGQDGNPDWTNFQLDGFGTWLWALDRHLLRTHESKLPWIQATMLLIDYLTAFWRQPSYDWWEESFGYLHTSTLACISVGMQQVSLWQEISSDYRARAQETAAEIREEIMARGVVEGHLTKWLGSEEVDGSLLALIEPLQFISAESDLAHRTILEIERRLLSDGVHRHVRDVYYGGGEWVILTAFLAQCHVAFGNANRVVELLEWILSVADGELLLPEQVQNNLLFPESYSEWVNKWGNPAHPLLWSHATFLTLICSLGIKEYA